LGLWEETVGVSCKRGLMPMCTNVTECDLTHSQQLESCTESPSLTHQGHLIANDAYQQQS
jgi:hypothetical protein